MLTRTFRVVAACALFALPRPAPCQEPVASGIGLDGILGNAEIEYLETLTRVPMDANGPNYYFSEDATGFPAGSDSNSGTSWGDAYASWQKAQEVCLGANCYFDCADDFSFGAGEDFDPALPFPGDKSVYATFRSSAPGCPWRVTRDGDPSVALFHVAGGDGGADAYGVGGGRIVIEDLNCSGFNARSGCFIFDEGVSAVLNRTGCTGITAPSGHPSCYRPLLDSELIALNIFAETESIAIHLQDHANFAAIGGSVSMTQIGASSDDVLALVAVGTGAPAASDNQLDVLLIDTQLEINGAGTGPVGHLSIKPVEADPGFIVDILLSGNTFSGANASAYSSVFEIDTSSAVFRIVSRENTYTNFKGLLLRPLETGSEDDNSVDTVVSFRHDLIVSDADTAFLWQLRERLVEQGSWEWSELVIDDISPASPNLFRWLDAGQTLHAAPNVVGFRADVATADPVSVLNLADSWVNQITSMQLQAGCGSNPPPAPACPTALPQASYTEALPFPIWKELFPGAAQDLTLLHRSPPAPPVPSLRAFGLVLLAGSIALFGSLFVSRVVARESQDPR